MKITFKKLFLTILLSIILITLIGGFCFAQKELEVKYPEVPGAREPGSAPAETAFPEYVKYIFNFAILIGGLLALSTIILGGSKYLSSIGNPSAIAEAKNQIFAGLLGLIILLSSYLILFFINPQLTTLTLPKLEKPTTPGVTPITFGKPTLTSTEIPFGKLIDVKLEPEEKTKQQKKEPKENFSKNYEGVLAETRLARIENTSKENFKSSWRALTLGISLRLATLLCGCHGCFKVCVGCPGPCICKGDPCTFLFYKDYRNVVIKPLQAKLRIQLIDLGYWHIKIDREITKGKIEGNEKLYEQLYKNKNVEYLARVKFYQHKLAQVSENVKKFKLKKLLLRKDLKLLKDLEERFKKLEKEIQKELAGELFQGKEGIWVKGINKKNHLALNSSYPSTSQNFLLSTLLKLKQYLGNGLITPLIVQTKPRAVLAENQEPILSPPINKELLEQQITIRKEEVETSNKLLKKELDGTVGEINSDKFKNLSEKIISSEQNIITIKREIAQIEKLLRKQYLTQCRELLEEKKKELEKINKELEESNQRFKNFEDGLFSNLDNTRLKRYKNIKSVFLTGITLKIKYQNLHQDLKPTEELKSKEVLKSKKCLESRPLEEITEEFQELEQELISFEILATTLLSKQRTEEEVKIGLEKKLTRIEKEKQTEKEAAERKIYETLEEKTKEEYEFISGKKITPELQSELNNLKTTDEKFERLKQELTGDKVRRFENIYKTLKENSKKQLSYAFSRINEKFDPQIKEVKEKLEKLIGQGLAGFGESAYKELIEEAEEEMLTFLDQTFDEILSIFNAKIAEFFGFDVIGTLQKLNQIINEIRNGFLGEILEVANKLKQLRENYLGFLNPLFGANLPVLKSGLTNLNNVTEDILKINAGKLRKVIHADLNNLSYNLNHTVADSSETLKQFKITEERKIEQEFKEIGEPFVKREIELTPISYITPEEIGGELETQLNYLQKQILNKTNSLLQAMENAERISNEILAGKIWKIPELIEELTKLKNDAKNLPEIKIGRFAGFEENLERVKHTYLTGLRFNKIKIEEHLKWELESLKLKKIEIARKETTDPEELNKKIAQIKKEFEQRTKNLESSLKQIVEQEANQQLNLIKTEFLNNLTQQVEKKLAKGLTEQVSKSLGKTVESLVGALGEKKRTSPGLKEAIKELEEAEEMMKTCYGLKEESKFFELLDCDAFWVNKNFLENRVKLIEKMEIEKPWEEINVGGDPAVFYCTQDLITPVPAKIEGEAIEKLMSEVGEEKTTEVKEAKIICKFKIPIGTVIDEAIEIAKDIKHELKLLSFYNLTQQIIGWYIANAPDDCKCLYCEEGVCILTPPPFPVCVPICCGGSACPDLGRNLTIIPFSSANVLTGWSTYKIIGDSAFKGMFLWNILAKKAIETAIKDEDILKPKAEKLLIKLNKETRKKLAECTVPAEDRIKALLGEKTIKKQILDCINASASCTKQKIKDCDFDFFCGESITP